jgi:hypothetical protein
MVYSMEIPKPTQLDPSIQTAIAESNAARLAGGLHDENYGDQPYGRFVETNTQDDVRESVRRHPAAQTRAKRPTREPRGGDAEIDGGRIPLQEAAEANRPRTIDEQIITREGVAAARRVLRRIK